MAYWGKANLPTKKSPPIFIKPGDGVNKFVNAFEIEKDEAEDVTNTSNQNYPALSPRRGLTSQYGSSSTPLVGVNGATARAGEQFHVLEGTTWKYWNGSAYANVATGLTDAFGEFLEFTTAADKFTVMFNGTDKKAWNGTTVTDLTQAPDTRFIAANDNRMFALKDSQIFTSDIGDITNWTTGDSDRIGLFGMIGSGTGIINYNDMIIAFSEQTMHIVFGKVSDDFDPTEPIPTGCISDRSIIIHGRSGVLFWMDYNKFMAYTGGLPQEVSQKVDKILETINYDVKENIVTGQSGRKIYISIPTNSSTDNNKTLEYDVERGMWYVWSIGFDNFYNIGQDLFGVSSTGIVYKINDGLDDDGTAISWSHSMGVNDFEPLKNLKHITDMYVIIDLPTGSELSLSFSSTLDGGDFELLKEFTPDDDEQNVRVRIPTTKLQRVNFYRLKFVGTGPCKVHYLEIHGRVGE